MGSQLQVLSEYRMSMKMSKWGSSPNCPACLKTVYPAEVVYAADRKTFHRGCITCQVRGCGNELTERGLFKHEGYNVCGQCYESLYSPRVYGPPPGMETLDERRRRLAREQEEREKRMKDLQAQRNSKVKRKLIYINNLLYYRITLE